MNDTYLNVANFDTQRTPRPGFLPAACGMVMGWVGVFLFFLGRLAFCLTFYIFKFRSRSISLCDKPQNTFRNGQIFKIFQILRILLVSEVIRISQNFRIFLVSKIFRFSEISDVQKFQIFSNLRFLEISDFQTFQIFRIFRISEISDFS